MNRFCVFCGNKPKNKNVEHVLPQWLLALTGNPKRKVTFGFNYTSRKKIEFSWKSLVVPACTVCNESFSGLEGRIKLLIQKLEKKIELTGNEILELLDWMDKVRIGLWINYYYLEKNKANIKPRLCINNRLGKKDRFLQIHFLNSEKIPLGLNAFGVNSLVFQFNPSCFGLKINNLLIVNGSNDFLVSKNCGFPYPNRIESQENGDLKLSDWVYDRELINDFDNLKLHKGVLTIMQPIQTEMIYESNYFNDSYLIQNCINREKRIGNLFRIKNGNLSSIYDLQNVLEYESVQGKEVNTLNNLTAKVFESQNVFFKKYSASGKLIDLALSLNKEAIDSYLKNNKNA